MVFFHQHTRIITDFLYFSIIREANDADHSWYCTYRVRPYVTTLMIRLSTKSVILVQMVTALEKAFVTGLHWFSGFMLINILRLWLAFDDVAF